jgi:predicted alpha-1,2-mannosidase
MKNITACVILILISGMSCTDKPLKVYGQESDTNMTRFVNPFIGTDEHGHTFPGATLPFGMIQLSPDTRLEGWDGCSGYHYSDSIVYGFSHTHLSGTGVPDYCDILFMPTIGKVMINNGAGDPDSGYASRFSHKNETASPGFYKTYLDDYDIEVQLTATKRAGFHKYIFPGGNASNIIIDLEHRDKVIESSLSFVNNSEVEGFRRSTGWASNQVVYFVARFSKPAREYGIYSDDRLIGEPNATGKKIKAYLSYQTKDQEEILVRVGISAVSIEGARQNLDKEIANHNFETIRQEANKSWNSELGKIIVKGGTDKEKITFYTALYHAFIAPNLFQDVDGQYLGRDFQHHRAQGFENYTVFSLWDTFRAEHPLFTLIQQKRTIDFIKTMLAQYEQGGRLPVWELAANETECMIGYHSIPVIVDAYVKGLTDFDAGKAYQAMKHSAELDHFGLKSYKENGFIPSEDEAESVSKTLEYAYDDWCIAIMAGKLGKNDDFEYFLKRAQSFKNIFDPSTEFMRAKMNGRWFEPFDPKEVNFNYTEANSWQYSFFVPQDINSLILMMGGKEEFSERLDQLFEENSETTGRVQSDITGLIGQYAHGNEPSHHMAYLYNFSGQPWKTQYRARQIMRDLYTSHPDGLCGNEDCGQMSAWYVLSAIGLYQVTPGDPVYTFGSPVFEEIKINFENGKSFTIKANNNSTENIYIQSAVFNGRKYNKLFIAHQEILNGGELVFEMGNRPATNLSQEQMEIPVSEISEHLIIPVPFLVTGERTFIHSTSVSLRCIDNNHKIFYTLDGSEPSEKSSEYQEPFEILRSVALKAIASEYGRRSNPLSVDFFKIPVGRVIKINTSYAGQYSAGGDLALIDFIRGPENFRTGAWQGYQGVDLDVVADLGSIQLISKLETGFLQDAGAWIFLPLEVQYFVSTEGKDFQSIGTVKNNISPKTEGVIIKNFGINFSTKTRYIRVVAKNRGICPEWHPGDGQPAWIFADEIVIK